MLRAELGDGIELVAPDLPGHGRDATAEAVSRDLDCAAGWVLEEVVRTQPEPIHLLGYSMGGRLAMHAALAAPERFASLTLISTSPGIRDANERQRRLRSDLDLADSIELEGLANFVDAWETDPLFLGVESDAALAVFVRNARLSHQPEALADALRAFSVGRQRDLRHELSSLRVPTLLIAGRRDKKFSALAAEMAMLMPAASVEIIDGAGHVTHVEAPRAVAELIESQVVPTG